MTVHGTFRINDFSYANRAFHINIIEKQLSVLRYARRIILRYT